MGLREDLPALRAALRDLERLVPREDRAVFRSPASIMRRVLGFALQPKTSPSSDEPRLDRRDPELIRALGEITRFLGRHYFRVRTHGIENVPATGPVLLVGNHNGGFICSEALFTALAVWDHHGESRRVYALAHDVLFHDPVFRTYAERIGVVRAGHGQAEAALGAGHCVLVYPGSDQDAFRPFSERNRVVLGGRKGFLKLALRAGVPIVPVASVGPHEQFIVLTRGEAIGRAIGLHRYARTSVFPLVLSAPWGFTSGFVPYLPLPAQISLAFGAPLSWPELRPEDASSQDTLNRCYGEVERTLQHPVDQLSANRRTFLGPPPGQAAPRTPPSGAHSPWTPGHRRGTEHR